MTSCANPLCNKGPPKDKLYIVHYKIIQGNMIGKAYFCLEHLPEESVILITAQKEIDKQLIIGWQ